MNNELTLEFIIALYVIIACVGTFLEFMALYEIDSDSISVKYIYDHSEMNIVCCFIVWLLLGIVSPVFFICKVIKWIGTVGRKKSDGDM